MPSSWSRRRRSDRPARGADPSASIDASIAGRVSLAVDLVPDLDGTSSQELTHDFPADSPPAPFGIELSLFIGLGVAAAIAVLLALRWLWRRLL